MLGYGGLGVSYIWIFGILNPSDREAFYSANVFNGDLTVKLYNSDHLIFAKKGWYFIS